MRHVVLVGSTSLIFTFACSGPSNGNNGNGENEVAKSHAAISAPGRGPLLVGQIEQDDPISGLLGQAFLYDPAQPNAFPAVAPFNGGDALAFGDLNNDGTPEIVRGVGNLGGGVELFNQSGTSLDPAAFGFGNQVRQLPFFRGDSVAVGDINGDGFGDIVMAHPGDGTSIDFGEIIVATSNGKPAIDENITDAIAFQRGGAMVVCDLDRDGFDDILTAPSFRMYSGRTGQVSSFVTTPVTFITGFDKLACGDLNNDGFDDLIIAHPSDPNASPSFADFQVVTNPALPSISYFTDANRPPVGFADSIAAGDLDGDGFGEFVVGHVSGPGPGEVEIFSAPGKTPPPRPQFASFTGADTLAIARREASTTPTTFFVPYLVQTILYQPPFNKSSTSYGTQNTLGTKTTWTMSFTDGVTFSSKTPIFSDNLTFTTTDITGHSVTTQTSNSVADGLVRNDTFCADPTVPCDPSLDPDHTADTFVMLFRIQGTAVDRTPLSPIVNVDLSTGTPLRFDVAELQGLAKTPQDFSIIQDLDKLAAAQTYIKTADAQQLLALDPYIANIPIDQHPERFEPACESAGSCSTPERLTVDTKPGSPATVADPSAAATHAQANGTETITGSSTGVKLDLSLGFTKSGVGFGVGDTTTITYQEITTVSNFTTLSAAITLRNSSHCEKGTVDLWLDKAFGSFLWVTNLVNRCLQQPMQTMSFEQPSDWQIQGGGAVTLSNQSVSGDHSFSIAASGWTPLVSNPLSSSQLRSTATSSNLASVSFALDIPTSQPNPFWIGAAQMYLTAPSANVFNAYMGQVELTPLPEGQFVRLNFAIPDYAIHALTEDHPDVSFTIVLNVNPGTSGWLIDDLQIGG